jgi:hypothetical protein
VSTRAAAATAILIAMVLVPEAAFASAPSATTSPASAVGSSAADLNGTVSPNKESTSYHFDYGTTTSYGSVTPTGSASGNASKNVSNTVTGLAANTTYHFRLVASNPSGTARGQDMTFKTSAPGTPPGGGGGGGGGGANAVSMSLKQGSIVFGHTVTISGKVTGSNASGVTVTLQESPFPFTSFKNVANATTSSNGSYTFTRKPGLNTRYRVVAKTSPPTTSSTAQENVKFFVSLRLSDSTVSPGSRVRFSGVCRPAHTGGLVLIQRRTSKGFRTVSRTLLKASTAGQSKYSKKVRITRAGTYRTVVPHDASHATGTSPRRTISFP